MPTKQANNKGNPEKDFHLKINGDFEQAMRRLAPPIKKPEKQTKDSKGRQK